MHLFCDNSEAATGGFHKRCVLKNPQENTCVRVSFLTKLFLVNFAKILRIPLSDCFR